MIHADAHVLLAYGFDGKGGAIPLAEQDISRQIKARNLTWVHFDAADPRTREWLHQEISYLDPFIIEALLADETRPRVTEVGDGAIIILRSVNLDAHADPEDMVSIRLWIDSHRIISVQLRTLKVVMDLAERLKTGHGPRSAGDFISMLIDKMFDGMEPALSTLDERIDEMEEEVLTPAPPEALREEIANIRRQAIIFRRYMAPQREAVAQLRNSDLRWLDGLHKRQLQESYDHITRFVENLDAVRERAQIIKDELAANMSNRISRNMYSISVMTAVFLPLTFITGLLGINVGGIPGAENSVAFYIICLILALLVAAQITVFKKFKWF